MELHAILTPEFSLQHQYWHGLIASMQLHEKRYIKRAGVAGIALRARGKYLSTIEMELGTLAVVLSIKKYDNVL
ncbi:hypothetical protein [Pectobacterium polaris]|uniref:hypothetical protein n=1 Tax=Pectobacterium polaris TaxID=2042057 RepID=UPI001F414D4D|nr:hypothetical protein [Pectobacterium polaris]